MKPPTEWCCKAGLIPKLIKRTTEWPISEIRNNLREIPSIPQTSLRTGHQTEAGWDDFQWTYAVTHPYIRQQKSGRQRHQRWSQQHNVRQAHKERRQLTWHSSVPEYTSWRSAWSSVQTTSSSRMERTSQWTWRQQHNAINQHTFQPRGATEDGCTVGWTECRMDRDTDSRLKSVLDLEEQSKNTDQWQKRWKNRWTE